MTRYKDTMKSTETLKVEHAENPTKYMLYPDTCPLCGADGQGRGHDKIYECGATWEEAHRLGGHTTFYSLSDCPEAEAVCVDIDPNDIEPDEDKLLRARGYRWED